MWVLNTCA